MTPLPTITGRPRRRGSRACSTEAKNASMSTWTTGRAPGDAGRRSAIEHHRGEPPGQLVRVEAQLVDVARGDRAGKVIEGLLADAVLPARVHAGDAMLLRSALEDDRRRPAAREIRAHADRLVETFDTQGADPRRPGIGTSRTLLHVCAV